MAWGKGAFWSMAIGLTVELMLIFLIFMAGAIYLALGLLAFCIMIIWLQCAAIRHNRYEITGDSIIVRCLGEKKRIYLIEKIQKIVFVDCGTEWMRNPPNSRYQLAIHFERKYIKSVEPRRFGPVDREAFVRILLGINPDIIVENDEKKIKETANPSA